jgi:hypothetical protein
MCHEICGDLDNYIVLDNSRDLHVNEFDLELEEFMMCMKYQLLWIFAPFIWTKKGHNILVLMFDPKFKNMWLSITYVGC